MAETKLNIGDSKSKKTYNKTLTPEQLTGLVGKKIGETVKGDALDLPAGYELEIRGGSNAAGFPMRKDVNGSVKKKILITKGVGINKVKYKGSKLRKTVSGNTISETTSQINMKVTKWGKEPIEKAPEPEATEEEAPAAE